MHNVGEEPAVILYTFINRPAGTPKQRQKDTRNLNTAQFCYIGSGIGCVSTLLYYNIQPSNTLQIDKTGDKVSLSDNYQANLTARGKVREVISFIYIHSASFGANSS